MVLLQKKNEAKQSSLTPEELISRLKSSRWPASLERVRRDTCSNMFAETRVSCHPKRFPICASLPQGVHSRKDPEFHSEMCDPVRQGVQAAHNRARHYHHEDLAKRAREILNFLKKEKELQF